MEQVEGREVGRFIREVGAVHARAVLVGCVLDDQKSEEGWPISGVCGDGALECRDPSGSTIRVSPQELLRFLVVDDRTRPQLRRTLEARLPEQERRARRIASDLARHGLSAASAEDAEVLAGVLEAVGNRKVPSFDQQHAFHEACKRAATIPDPPKRRRALAAGARVFAAIDGLTGLDPSVRIKLAFFLRHAGETRAAVAATEFIEDPRVTSWVSRETLSILATERAACLADLYEQERDEAVLHRADYWGRRAFAMSAGSAEAAAALHRIRALGGRAA
jgi:hypothetical protein